MSLSSGTIVNNKWKIGSLVGEGACAKVYDVSPVGNKSETDLVMKVIGLETHLKGKKKTEQKIMCDTLYYEYTLYTGVLTGFPFLPYLPPNFYGNDQTNNVRFLVLEKLDHDLKRFAIINKNNKNFLLRSIGTYGKDILRGLRFLHDKNFLFIDLKPDNFMLKNDKLYFIDCEYFSLSLIFSPSLFLLHLLLFFSFSPFLFFILSFYLISL